MKPLSRARRPVRRLLGVIGLALLPAVHAADPAGASQHQYSWAKNSRDWLRDPATQVAVVARRDEHWQVVALNERRSIASADEEIVLARRRGTAGWEFAPLFDLVDTERGQEMRCIGPRPVGLAENTPIDRARQTSPCQSLLTSSTRPEGLTAGRAAGILIGTVLTGGLGAVAMAMDKRTEYFPLPDEFKKLVRDTRLDELLSQVEAQRQLYDKALARTRADWAQAARQTRTRFAIRDDSQGLASGLPVREAERLVGYAPAFPKAYATLPAQPTTLDGLPAFAAQLQARLAQLAAEPVVLQPSCPGGSRRVGTFNVSLPACPGQVLLSGPDAEVELPLVVNGVKAELAPAVQADDKLLRVQWQAGGLVIENRSADFVDILDVALSVNGKVRTLSGERAPLLTVPPQSTHPRSGEAGRFSARQLLDAEMQAALSFDNLTLPQAQAGRIATQLSVRYAIDGRPRTLRGASSATILELMR